MSTEPNTQSLPVVNDEDLAMINDALADLEIEQIAEGGVEEMIVDEVIEETEEVDETIEAALESSIERADAYEAQDAGAEIMDPPAGAPEPEAEAKAPKTRKAAGTGTPRVARDVSALPEEAFVLTTDVPADLAANKAAVLASRPLQKKIAEKFDNMLAAVSAGRKPSTYVCDCFRILQAKGEVTSTELVAGLRAITRKDGVQTYTEGTARSQAGQIMSLFATLKIATREKHTLKLNPDSTLAMALKDLV